MKVLLLTTLPNHVAGTLSILLGDNLSILDIKKVGNKKYTIAKTIKYFTPNLLITYRCPYVLPNEIIKMLPFGAYNIHPSLLPLYKGLNPWQEIFQNKETESGVTLHRITKEIDSGGIVSQKAFGIMPSDTVETARRKADNVAAELCRDFINTLISNEHLLPLPNKFDYQEAMTSSRNLGFIKEQDIWSYKGVFTEGSFCIVFQMLINEGEYAIRCWKLLDEKSCNRICRRMTLISEWLQNNQLPYLIKFHLFKKGIQTIKGIYPVVVMEWYDDMSLKEYISCHYLEPSILIKLSDSFIEMVSCFHKYHIAHGDLNMDNIRVTSDGNLYLIDYDTFYVPTMKCEKDDIKGKPGYQHHARHKNMYLSEYIDLYSEYIIFVTLYSLAYYPELWSLFDMSNTECGILNDDELRDIKNSRIFSFMNSKHENITLQILLYMDEIWQNSLLNEIIPIEKFLSKIKSL